MAKTYIDNEGYRRFSGSNELVHRWVAEMKLGRKLKDGEVVHHKDRDKSNNSPSNLHIFRDQKEHDRIHEWDKRRFGPKASYQGFYKINSNKSGCMSMILILVLPIIFAILVYIV